MYLREKVNLKVDKTTHVSTTEMKLLEGNVVNTVDETTSIERFVS